MKTQRLVVAVILSLLGCSPCLAENLIINPSFEGNFIGGVAENWTAWGSADSYYEGGEAHEGVKSQAISWNCDSFMEFGPGGIYQQINNLRPGHIYLGYLGSAWFKINILCDNCYISDLAVYYAIGVDPNGGTNPDAVEEWKVESFNSSWPKLNFGFMTNLTTATVFIKIYGYAGDRYVFYPDCCCEVPPCTPPCTTEECMVWAPGMWVTECLIDDINIFEFVEPNEVYACCQNAKLFAPDGAPNDFFGYSVAISGDTVLVGSIEDDDKGNDSGSAYIFRLDGNNWIQQDKLVASDGNENDYFGYSVGISGDTAVIGTVGDDDNYNFSGSAYIFRFDGNDWIQQAKLLPADGNAFDFGFSASISGYQAIIGARGDNHNGSNSGSAYIFRFDGNDWVQEAKLLASDGAAFDFFGSSVAISGNAAIVGAWQDSDNGIGSGSAYVFRFDGNDWIQQKKLVADDGAAGDYFGGSVAISGDTAVVGAYLDDDMGYHSGSAYIFRFDGNDWIQKKKLLAPDGDESDLFGWSVAISGDTAVIGAWGDDDKGNDSGSAYIFRFDDNDWIGHDKLVASDGYENDCFGQSVAISGNTVIIGAEQNYYSSVYIFEHQPGDIDGSCDVDLDDLSILTEQWLQPPGRPSADLVPKGGDDSVNLLDFAFIAENWLDSILP